MIIESMLDNDQYKFTMLQGVLHQHPAAMVEYLFKCRTPGADFRAYVNGIAKEVSGMCKELRFTKEDLEYLGDLRYMRKDTIQFLKLFRFDYDYVNIAVDSSGDLHILVKGPWLHTILFEVPILSIVSEIYSRDISEDFGYADKKTLEKIEIVRDLYNGEGISLFFADFGGRRRHSVEAHRRAVRLFVEGHWVEQTGLVGTSNVMLAREHGIKSIGTMAHEWLEAHQALYRVADSQSIALENWAKEYRGDLGIALSDTIGLKHFLHDFDMYFSKLFDGTRQDSGDPYEYGDALIKHYENMNIDPKTKTVVFSDGLDFKKAADLARYFNGRIKTSFGIGTNLTNDFGPKALQIVLKMTRCNGQPVAKLSDTPEKGMCTDQGYVGYLKDVFNRRIAE